MAPEALSRQQIDEALSGLPGWQADGDTLARTYAFDTHLPAAAMALHVAMIQDELNHHAELTLGYNRLGIAVNTHSAGGRITELDTTLARRITEIAAGHGAR
ncbi:4a-hydroxytetrahydrobiopterin dehydratase [Streptomyces sp. DSM 42041]|uniref:Putative pterin-4-alpha-carbinolamine dehydratase n=1 Tax=Streptomyces hazeniae TaxID=3075538 RepID=A0ABU2NSZ8_9ACTN|nr:4a-hydroxytetrahydrobiopterin dehydratase [Streptomyces sp. DSM 42041]MDT0380116.1 4a-hydroxytetrahydrobiopterin dehydratase [Streptomyces sp. DSM 42041]